jgi:hypothetical protein
LAEYIFLHNSGTFQQAKSRVLMVISLSSAAGGTKVADYLENPSNQGLITISNLVNTMHLNTAAYQDLTVQNSTHTYAPFNLDPGVPFFMVAGFSPVLFGAIGAAPTQIFNGDLDLPLVDSVVQPGSRGDGLVDFRSACGVASDDNNNGPGYTASLAQQFQYCATAPKKPNHFAWFAINLNHYLTAGSNGQCLNSVNPCQTFVYQNGNMVHANQYDRLDTGQIIRTNLRLTQ